MRRLLGIVLALPVLAGLGIGAFFLWARSGELEVGAHEGQLRRLDDVAIGATDTSTLTVASWNIAWGCGPGSEGTGEPIRSVQAIGESLDRMGAELRARDVDVALLQEVDLAAARSGDLDQAERVARAAGLPFVCSAASWNVRYLPFPYLPISGHWGRIRSGGAIVSRFPLEDCRIELFEKPAAQPAWYRPFYLSRYVLRATARVGPHRVPIGNVHLEAFDRPNREQQAAQLATAESGAALPHRILGGDFNAPPPESPRLHGFEDEPGLDFRGDTTIRALRAVPGLVPAADAETSARREAELRTFPAHAPNRQLDHLFFGPSVRVHGVEVLREVGELSDHLPLLARISLLAPPSPSP